MLCLNPECIISFFCVLNFVECLCLNNSPGNKALMMSQRAQRQRGNFLRNQPGLIPLLGSEMMTKDHLSLICY